MTRKGKAGPQVDGSAFQQQDAQLEQDGAHQQVVAVKPCDNAWKLRVDVKGLVSDRKPKLEHARVRITWDDGKVDMPRVNYPEIDSASSKIIEDKGARTAICRASAKGWYLEAEKSVALVDGDNKSVRLVLKPAVWVALSLVDHKTGDPVEKVKVNANLSVIGSRKTSTIDAVLDIEHDDLRPDSTLTLADMSHDDIVWEVVGGVTSV